MHALGGLQLPPDLHERPLRGVVAVDGWTSASALSLAAGLERFGSAAAFVIPYDDMLAIWVPYTNVGSAPAVPTTTILLSGAVEARRRGRNAEMLWMTPSALILYCRSPGISTVHVCGEWYDCETGDVQK